ncbi:hypothetical protein C4J91_2130 [Pseudomonas sp. R3-52-08]|nr:hypothetical protein C4J91_2130 [Pseudomonas sp. R3-52-08]
MFAYVCLCLLRLMGINMSIYEGSSVRTGSSWPTDFASVKDGLFAWRLTVGTEDISLINVSSEDACQEHYDFSAGWHGLLVGTGFEVICGAGHVQSVSLATLARLQLFIDQSGVLPGEDVITSQSFNSIALEITNWQSDIESWYLEQGWCASHSYLRLAAYLRRTEAYGLVSFLWGSGTGAEKLHSLAKRYGVSVPHFRRLCRRVIGKTTKTQLRDWRLARALMDLTEGKHTLVEIALNHGFSSSAHFSREMSELLGVSPRGLSDITKLAAK